MDDDAELEAIRRRKMAEMHQSGAAQEQQAAVRAEAESQKQMVLRLILEPEARERLTRVRMARPEIAEALENQLLMLYQQGRVRGKIDDPTLRELLHRIQPKRPDTTIERR